ncbi:MAG: hypothetical protein R3E93_02790 [Thiothrix sp.]
MLTTTSSCWLTCANALYAGKGIILVDISQQKAVQCGQGGGLLGTYRVSTATKGAGSSNSGSDQTAGCAPRQ